MKKGICTSCGQQLKIFELVLLFGLEILRILMNRGFSSHEAPNISRGKCHKCLKSQGWL